VVDAHGAVVGVLTDRDICLAGGATHRELSRISVKETMTRPVFSCFAEENVKVVLATMAKHRVRRLPVLTKDGHLAGVLSIEDIVQAPQRRGAATADEIVAAEKGIFSARRIQGAIA
jgi:CBS domain-containing protein